MVRIAHFRKILKDDFFKRIEFFVEFLSARDILDVATAENYHWRDRIWTPIHRPLHRLSFAGTLHRVNAVLPYLWLFSGTKKAVLLYQYLLNWIARDKLPCRPNQIEPRAVKRRPKEYALLNKPRSEMREALLQ